MDKPCFLYRHFDARGRLLYIGQTTCLKKRLLLHWRKPASPWISRVARIETEEFPSRRAALAAEVLAIKSENPIHNSVGNTERHRRLSLAGIAKAAAAGRFPGGKPTVTDEEIRAVLHLDTGASARAVGLTKAWFIERRRRLEAQEAATP